jgi:putative LysE/RhtB family amino acid efflux pump
MPEIRLFSIVPLAMRSTPCKDEGVDLLLLGKCVVLGLAVAAPLGPIGTLCINRTLKKGFRAGFAGGLGTAMGDALYAAVAALGFSAFAATLAAVHLPLKLVGGLLMLWLGWRSIVGHPLDAAKSAGSKDSTTHGAKDLSGTVLMTFLLTITNPMTVFFFAAMFASLGSVKGANSILVVAGIFSGSLLWWLILCGGVALARQRLPLGLVRWVARVSGSALVLIGVLALGSALWEVVIPAAYSNK